MVGIFSSLSLVFLLLATTSYAVPVSHVTLICQGTLNPSFCSSLLKNQNESYFHIAQYTLDVARANVTNTINLIKKLIAHSTKDPTEKTHFRSCLYSFGPNGVLGDINYAHFLFKRKEYEAMSVAIASIQSDIDDCTKRKSPSDAPYHDPSQLSKYIHVVELVANVILIFAKYLVP
uniref:Pectinesterase inhibitor 1 n=1 Tax=Cajanus cajan TaxID=3821 RepID=A0A151SPE0_CAJCA|nr:Pectinesterase inhibitor 1 [Cajanus cajan]